MRFNLRFAAVALFFSLFHLCGGSFGQQAAPPEAKLILEGPTTIIRGFPAILKLRAYGQQFIPTTTIFTTNDGLSVVLTSVTNGTAYTIESTSGRYVIMGGPNGEMMDGTNQFLTLLPEGNKHTMLLDLWSLRQEGGKVRILDDLLDDDYDVQVRFPRSELLSPKIRIKFRSPTLPEQEFLDNSRERYFKASEFTEAQYKDVKLNWAAFLRHPVEIDDSAKQKLDPEAASLFSFHAFYLNLLLNKGRFAGDSNGLLKDLNSMAVPPYLELEKKSLLVEIRVLKDGLTKSQPLVDSVLAQDPGFQWRFEKLAQGAADFQVYGGKSFRLQLAK